jgi:ABC-type Na+ efflux pump permease subunit
MMERNNIIIIALIVIIAALLVTMVFTMMPNMQKQDSKLKFKGNDTLKKGDSIKIKLTDSNGKEISGQSVNVTITDKDKASDYHSVETDENGVGTIKIDKDPGKYKVKVTYDGNDKYKASNATKTITVEEKEEVQEASSSSSSSTPSAYAYKSDGTPMYSQAEVDSYMHNKYGNVNYHIAENGYMDMDQPGYDDAGHWIGYR